MSRLPPGSVVVVTGAGSGIGRATALAFAKRGCRIVLGDIDSASVRETADRARARYGIEALALTCDVRNDEDVRALVSGAAGLGRLDVLVNNAGRGHYGRVEDTSAESLRELFDVNVLGVQRGIAAAVPIMREQGSGHIVIVGSVNGKQSWPYHGPYAATKFALTALARTLRMELAGSGVSLLAGAADERGHSVLRIGQRRRELSAATDRLDANGCVGGAYDRARG